MKIQNRLIALASVGVTLSLGACGPARNQKAYEYLPNMIYSVPYDQFSQDQNGKPVMRSTPEGAISRGHAPLHYQKTLEDAERAGRELINPYKPTTATVARGQFLFENYCMACHGVEGKGDGPLIPAYFPPPSYLSDTLVKYTDGRLYYDMTVGIRNMASYAQQISNEDRWYLVHYIRKLQENGRGTK